MVEKQVLEEWLQVIDSLIAQVEPMPDVEDMAAVIDYFKRAPDMAENALKKVTYDMCGIYLKEL
jgi:hypothetical protein